MGKILILGSTGMLGKAIAKNLKKKFNILGLSTSSKPISKNLIKFDNCKYIIENFNPSIVINCTGYISIEKCEKNLNKSYLANTQIPYNFYLLNKINKFRFIQISTDQFYVNKSKIKYSEKDKLTLVNNYAFTKSIAESIVQLMDKYIIIRTNVIGKNRNSNFLNLFNKIKSKSDVISFYDYYTCSIHVDYFSKILEKLISKKQNGIFNLVSSNCLPKSDLIEFARKFYYGNKNKIYYKSVDSLRVKRAKYCNLDTFKIEKLLNTKMPKYQKSIYKLLRDYE